MRFIFLDTETTGLDPASGDKIVEIGAAEVVNRDLSKKKTYQQYINPQRPSSTGAFRVHGLSEERLQGEPLFSEIEEDFLNFIRGGVLVIHNAPFDLAFLMNELSNAGKKELESMSVIDSFKLAKSLFKSKNSLDALCDKLGIDRKHRTLHGALLDAELLAEVYIQMTGGSQFTLGLESQAQPVSSYAVSLESAAVLKERKETSGLTRRPAIKLRQSDMTAHQAMMQRIHKESGGQTLWSLPGRKKRAQSYMQQAEAMLLITGGAFDFKTGHDALPITKLFRDAYPAYDKQDPKKKIHIQDERIFTTFPEMAWAFYAEYINRARDAEEDEFLKQWLQLAKAKPSGYFAYTSRLDGMYQALGCDEDKIVEVYGSLHHLQCLSDCQKEVKPNNLTFELYMNELRSDVPRCPNCTQPLIPNIKLVNQSHCNPQRKETQEQALQQWLKHLEKENQRLVVVEVACNDPMVQSFANQLSEHEFVRLIRLNMHYQYGRVPESGLALNMDIHQGLALFLDD